MLRYNLRIYFITYYILDMYHHAILCHASVNWRQQRQWQDWVHHLKQWRSKFHCSLN